MDCIKKYSKKASGYLCIGSIVLYYGLQFSLLFSSWMKIFLFLGFLFGVVFFALNFKKRQAIVTCLMIPFIIVLGNGDTRFISIYLSGFIIYLYKVDLMKFIKMLFYLNLANTMFLLVFGYTHINGLSIQIGLDIMLFVIVYEEAIKWKHIVFMICLVAGVYVGTRSGQFLICMGLFLLLYVCKDKMKKVLEGKIVLFSFFIAAMANIIIALTLHSNIFRIPDFLYELFRSFAFKLDALMNYRLSLSQISLNYFGVKIWGNVLNYSDFELHDAYFNVDSGYVQLLQTKGLIVFLCMMFIYSCIVYYLQKNKQYVLIIVSIILAFWGINEDIILSIKVNVVLLFAILGINEVINFILDKKRNIKNGKSDT